MPKREPITIHLSGAAAIKALEHFNSKQERMIKTRESIIALQEIDCNCSDCAYMVRDLAKHAESVELHHTWQWDYFSLLQRKKYERAADWRENGDQDKADAIDLEADAMRFQFDRNKASINFGFCSKFNKDLSFIPNNCQLDTQHCFKHRRL